MSDQAITSTQPAQQDTRADRPGQHKAQASSLDYAQIDDVEVGNISTIHIRSLAMLIPDVTLFPWFDSWFINVKELSFYQAMCTICRRSAKTEETYLICGHLFHDGCISVWLPIWHNCPNCR